jgi:hypothetical protein
MKRRLFVALALLSALHPALAHRVPGTSSTVDWNPRSGLTEITHRLHVHDALTGVERFYEGGPLSVTDPKHQARIALYVEDRFEIEFADGTPIMLRTLGAELEGDYLLVYQETATRLRGPIRIRNDILRDALPVQVNEVFIRTDNGVRTLRFETDDDWLAITP